jgi:hypothetical protein
MFGMLVNPLQVEVADVEFELLEGDARNVLCDAVERHHAEMLVVGSHGYGAIKRSANISTPMLCSALLCFPTSLVISNWQHKNTTNYSQIQINVYFCGTWSVDYQLTVNLVLVGFNAFVANRERRRRSSARVLCQC